MIGVIIGNVAHATIKWFDASFDKVGAEIIDGIGEVGTAIDRAIGWASNYGAESRCR